MKHNTMETQPPHQHGNIETHLSVRNNVDFISVFEGPGGGRGDQKRNITSPRDNAGNPSTFKFFCFVADSFMFEKPLQTLPFGAVVFCP